MSSFLSWWYSNTASATSSTNSIKNSPPRKVHVGLSIDSDSSRDSETSSLSDFEEGMPLWAKETPPRLLMPNTATQMSTPIGFQIRMPKRGAALSLDATHETLTQRTSIKPNLSLPILNDYRDTEGVWLKQRQPQEEYILESSSLLRTTKFPRRLLKLFFGLMAMGMVAASVNQQLYTEIMNETPEDIPAAAASTQPIFPNYYMQQQPKQPQSFASGPSTNQQRRSNLALARSQESLPVFGQVVGENRVLEQESPSDSWISWLGGCAFCLVLLETGWKGYRQSRVSHEARRR
jgi:hypothetical protein